MKTLLILLVTTFGNITVELDADKAPKSVDNFVQYVNEGHYNGTTFHRVIDGFMIQGGGFTEAGQQKPTRAPIANEANNGLKNDRGTIAMARTGDPQSATAQFYINTVNNDFLNYKAPTQQGWGYTVFGRVTEGMDVVDRIAKVPTGYQDKPLQNVVIKEARVLKADDGKPATPAAAKPAPAHDHAH